MTEKEVETVQVEKEKKFKNDKEREEARKKLLEQMTKIILKKPLLSLTLGNIHWGVLQKSTFSPGNSH